MTETLPHQPPTASRRHVVCGLAAAGIAGPLLAGCGSDDGGAPSGGSVSASEIPVGGGKIFGEEKFVITQPTKGEFKAFTAVCTHQACLVTSVEKSVIHCNCHGSEYSITDGSVTQGPATKGLDELSVSVSGDELEVTA